MRKRGSEAPNWKGGKTLSENYILDNASGKREHVLVVERVLGKPMPPKAVVHHVDGNGQNNTHSNLVLCNNHAYHNLLHALARIQKAGGRPFLDRICTRCKQVFPKTAMTPSSCHGKPAFSSRCRPCNALVAEEGRQRRAAAGAINGTPSH
jgi:phage FluMu protein Com